MAHGTGVKLDEGLYLYAVVNSEGVRNYGNLGIEKREVYSIDRGAVAAIVSDISPKKLRPRRQNLAAHHQVLKRLLEEHSVLPVSFGIVAKTPEEIQELLERNSETFTLQLGRVAGKREMGLRVTWEVNNIFEYMVNRHPLLKSMRDELFAADRSPIPEKKISLGNAFEKILDTERNSAQRAVQSLLKGICFETMPLKVRSEYEVMNLACLVEDLSEFERGIEEVVAFFEDPFLFDYNGPWAPHNFVDLKIEF